MPPEKGKASVRSIIEEHFPRYRFVDVDTKSGAAAIDTSITALVVTQPATDLTEKELRRIDDFVLAGKSLAVIASAVNLAAGDPTMHATLATHGVEVLLAGYGIEMRKDVVEDFGRSFQLEAVTTTSTTPVTLRFPTVLDIRDDERFTGDAQLLDSGFVSSFRIEQIFFPFASSLVIHPERQPHLEPGALRVIARSTPQADRETSKEVDLSVVLGVPLLIHTVSPAHGRSCRTSKSAPSAFRYSMAVPGATTST